MSGNTVTILHIENRDAVEDRDTRKFLREVEHPVAQKDTRGPDQIYGQSELHFFKYEPVDSATAHHGASRKRGNVWVEHGQMELPDSEWTWHVPPDAVRELPSLDRGVVKLGGDTELKW